MAQFIDDNRFLVFDTPLGPDRLLLRRFEGEEAMSRLFRFRLELLSEDESIDFAKILGQNATVALRLPGQQSPRFFNGHVARFVQQVGHGGFALYEADFVPWLWFLTRTADCRIFQRMTVPDIVAKIFSERGFSDWERKLTRQYRRWEYCVQYRETACNFVMRLLEQEGIFFFFRHENGKHTLVLADDPTAHQPVPDPEVRFQRGLGAGVLLDEDVIFDWRREEVFLSGRYALNDYNFETPTQRLLANTSSLVRHRDNQSFEVFDYPGEYLDRGQGEHFVRQRMEEEEAGQEEHWGAGHRHHFQAGSRFDLAEHPRADFNQSYVLTRVAHDASDPSYEPGRATDTQEYANSFTVIPARRPFRPARVTPRPLVEGTQTAFVVGPAGEEIFTDKHGRVKVQFHWDREHKMDEDSSCWIRVAQAWAGAGWGSIFIPRIGMEVVVAFLEGDPDQPIVVGVVYNGQNVPPYALPEHQTRSTTKTNSSKGGGGFNEIRFEDKKGKEQIFIHGQRDEEIRILNDAAEFIGHDRHLVVKRDQAERVERDRHLEVKGDHAEAIDGMMSHKVGQDRHEKVAMSYALDAGMAIHVKAGMSIVVEAGVQISLKVGGSFVNINPAGVQIVGPMVLINSGGAPGVGAGAHPVPPM
ncbi:MAG: type VI secretion system Vgr family protein [Alphaproteobacteria bacterium]